MDRYVVRSPKVSPSSSPRKAPKFFRQATIETLKGVVVIEDLERARVVLERDDTPIDLKVDTLEKIGCKNPGKDILIKTKIGKTVHKLCKHEDKKLAAAANKVYKKWKENIVSKVGKPSIEVAYDDKTQNFRNTARKWIRNSLQGDSKNCVKSETSSQISTEECGNSSKKDTNSVIDDTGRRKNAKLENTKQSKDVDIDNLNSLEGLAEYIEREVYKECNRLIGKVYKRIIRRIVFKLKDPQIRTTLTN
ncbi:transcription elongation factor A N-terminal and central domain-containing protein 2-like [Oratosquilla oratoria]|uniref:transcription elongation factor A N-terminal and central domain-containing protein 2-like n=1 Tax=Oratosquilla oratoria TaxID=337810 RepID=UPI003F761A46